jgi:hypothetical protein
MGAEVKYLGDGTAVLVVGEGPTESTSLDGGRTLTDVPTVTIARLTTENVHPEQLYSEVPEVDEESGAVVTQADAVASAVEAPGGFDRTAGTPSGATDREVIASRGEVQTTDQLDAEIARLTAERDALAAGGSDNATNAPAGAPEPRQA